MSTGLNAIIDDLVAVEEKVGTGASTATANTVLRGTGAGTTAYGQIVSADITDGTIVAADLSASAGLAATQLAPGAANTILVGGASNAFSASPTVSGTLTATTGLSTSGAVAAATGNTSAAFQAGTTLKAGTKIYPGTLNGPVTGIQATVSVQNQYLNSALAANTSATIATFPIGHYYVHNVTTGACGFFSSNSISTVTDRGSDTATIQIAGADPGASTSKIWISLSTGTLTIYNRYATAQFICITGTGIS